MSDSSKSEQNGVEAKSKVAATEETTPNDLFKQMAVNDAKQNQRLSATTAAGAKKAKSEKQPAETMTRTRFFICTLGLMSLATSQMSRMVLNSSISEMVDPRMLKGKEDVSGDGSCPWPEETLQTVELPAATATTEEDLHIEDGGRDNPEVESHHSLNQTSSEQPTNDKFMWSIKQQNVLLGGFYYSYFFFMILGGRMSEIYGAKYVLLLSVAGSALISLATPFLARTSFELLVLSRVVMGAIQAGVFPGMYALINKWLTMSEASIYTPMIKMFLRLGMVLGTLVPGLVAGWPNVFYLTGALSALWSFTWLLVATSTPAENKWVSAEELKHIQKKKAKPLEAVELSRKGDAESNSPKVTTKKTPWLKLITAPSVVGLILVKLTFNYALDFLAIELPSYLKYVHHTSREKQSAITTAMFSIQVVLVVFVGWLAKVMVQKRPFNLSKTAIRKLFQGLASYGMGAALFLFTFNDCNIVFVAILLQVISILSMFTAGGETMLPYDLSQEYPATIMSIANSVANVSGITTTTLAGLILGDEGGNYKQWNKLIYLIAGANMFGGLAFTFLVRAEPIDFGADSGGG